MNSKILLFDFDGTIVDSKQVYYKAMIKHLNPFGFSKKRIDKEIKIGLSVAKTLKKLGFSFIENWILKRKIMKDVLKYTKEIKKCKDVDSIKNLKIKKVLISNSTSDFVFPILKHLKLKKEFEEIYTADNFNDKTEFIKEYLKDKKIKNKDAYYIGDRVADVLLAKNIGCKSSIAAGKCSWDSRKEILKAEPDFVVSSLSDIKKILSQTS